MKMNAPRFWLAAIGTLIVSASLLWSWTRSPKPTPAPDPCCPASEGTQSKSCPADSDEMFLTQWTPPNARQALPLSHTVTRHDGTQIELRSLIGRPMVLSFVYTRCTNPNKCKAVITQMAVLRKRLDQSGLLPKVRLILVTYDAQWDTLEDLRAYARCHQLDLDDSTLFLRPIPEPDHRFYRDFNVTASFNPAGVSLHGIQMLLVDKAGRLARTYRLLLWDNDQVLQDLSQLLNE